MLPRGDLPATLGSHARKRPVRRRLSGSAVTSDGDSRRVARAIDGELDRVDEHDRRRRATPNSSRARTHEDQPATSSWSWLTDWNSPKRRGATARLRRLSAGTAGRTSSATRAGTRAECAHGALRRRRRATTTHLDHSATAPQEQRDEWLRASTPGATTSTGRLQDTDSQAIHQWYDKIAADTAANTAEHYMATTLRTGSSAEAANRSYEADRGAENGTPAAAMSPDHAQRRGLDGLNARDLLTRQRHSTKAHRSR